MRQVAIWQQPNGAAVTCPVCKAAGLAVTDRSARPHAEWYHLACSACGLDATVGVPMGSRPPTLD